MSRVVDPTVIPKPFLVADEVMVGCDYLAVPMLDWHSEMLLLGNKELYYDVN